MLNMRKSNSFKFGICDGFTSMFGLASGYKRYTYRHYDTVAYSWHEVGHLLKEASEIEGRRLAEKDGRRSQFRKVAAG